VPPPSLRELFLALKAKGFRPRTRREIWDRTAAQGMEKFATEPKATPSTRNRKGLDLEASGNLNLAFLSQSQGFTIISKAQTSMVAESTTRQKWQTGSIH
jgi:hypothetical protein